jgi:hypothetical protein
MRDNISSIIDSNLNTDNLEQSKEIKLSILLDSIMMNVQIIDRIDDLSEYNIKLLNGTNITLYRETISIKKIFEKDSFLSNYFYAFNQEFETLYFEMLKFTKCKLKITIDLKKNNNITLNTLEVSNFRFFVCLIFGLRYNIMLSSSVCLPNTLEDILLMEIGLGKNRSNKCIAAISKNPYLFDSLLHFDTIDMKVNCGIDMFSLVAGKNIIINKSSNNY